MSERADAVGMDNGDDPGPVGAIFDTNSDGRFDLVIYDDGLLAVKGTYVGVALRAAGAGVGGVGAPTGWSLGTSYESKRLAEKLAGGREYLMNRPPNFFIPRDRIAELMLRKRWHGHALTLRTHTDAKGRTFDWKPRLNNFAKVEERLRSAFPDLVHRE